MSPGTDDEDAGTPTSGGELKRGPMAVPENLFSVEASSAELFCRFSVPSELQTPAAVRLQLLVGGSPVAQATFELRAALLHGGDIEVGHFKTVACWHGEWWLCHDKRVRPCGSDELTGASADTYGVFYARIG